MDVRMIDTETGEVTVVAEGRGTKRMGGGYFKGAGAERTFDQGAAQEALRPAVEQVTARITAQSSTVAARMPAAPEGQIVSTRDGQYFINRGQNAGVKVGTLEVTQVLSQPAICSLLDGNATVKDVIK